MERKRFRVGSIAVLFAVVVFCVAIFSTLTVVTATADYRTARRYGDHVKDLYACQALGEQWLARVDGYLAGTDSLPEGSWQEGDAIGTEISDGQMQLQIELEVTPDGYRIVQWNCTTQWEPAESWTLLH